MIRLTPWGAVARELAGTGGAQSGTHLLHRLSAPTHSVAFWVSLWIAAFAAAVVALFPVIFQRGLPVAGSEVVFRLVGFSFAACGLIAWRRRPDSDVGRLMTAAGFAIYIFPIASQLGSSFLLTLATLFSSVWIIAFTALLLSFVTGGRLESRVDRAIVGTMFFALFVLQFVRMLFADFPDNLLLIVRGQLEIFTAIGDVQMVLSIAAALGIVLVTAARWRQASPPGRRALLPSVAGCLCAVMYAAMLMSWLVARSIPEWLSWVTNAALLTVPAAFLAGMMRSRLARGGLVDLFRELGGLRGERLQAGLARSLGDPSLVLAYRSPEGGRYIAADGEPAAVPMAGRATARVERDGRELGALLYDPSLDDDPELVKAVSAAAAIALDDERLHVESETRLAELRASRERLVTASDAERRRLERNLHDGAQQRLVSVAMQLRMIENRIRDNPSAALELVSAAGDELSHSLEELRELARGIHPAVLNHGLGAALDSLATRSPVPTTVSCHDADGLPEPLELAVYFVACEALANVAKYALATEASVHLSRSNGTVVIEIADNGVGGADPTAGSGLRGLEDRVAALDGTLRVSSPPGAGTVVRAELPYTP